MLTLQRTPLNESLLAVVNRHNVAIARLTCRVVRERQAQSLELELRKLCDDYEGRVILDVSTAPQFTCAWINTMILLTRKCRAMGGEFFVTGFERPTLGLFRSTGIDTHLHVVTSIEQAMGAFGMPHLSGWRLALARLLELPLPPEPVTAAPASATWRHAA